MLDTSRRTFMSATAFLHLAAMVRPVTLAETSSIEADLRKYVGFGIKRAGSPGDMACGNWLAGELEAAGYSIERQTISVPFFSERQAELTAEDTRRVIYPQPIVVGTGPAGVSGPLVRVDEKGRWQGSLDGAIALVDLPYSRWSTLLSKAAREPIGKAFAGGAVAVVAITNGPTGKVIALNTDGRKPMFGGPLALIAPEDANPFLGMAMNRTAARLVIDGHSGRRDAFNFVGRVDRGKEQWLAISTPRSGWFTCAGERGGGVAAWLYLARRAKREFPAYNLAFVCNTGHEYEYLGAAEAMKKIAPPPAKTKFWLHLGANVAARDWHDLGGQLTPLPSVDSQRYLSVSPSLLDVAGKVFEGQPGFEAPVSSKILSAGELDEVIAAGYSLAAGVFGLHRYHHVALDDERCLDIAGTSSVAAAFVEFVGQVLA